MTVPIVVVEEQVGQLRAREISCVICERRENEAVRRYSARDSFLDEVCLCGGVAFEQPKDATLDLAEQAHPDVEHLGRDLEGVVEAAEHEAARGQADILA